MARPREFDEKATLRRAVELFWEHGYEATSIRDLAQAMELTTASLYNAFGDKRSIYRKALDFYIAGSFGDRVGRFEKLPPYQAITAFFAEIIDRSLNDAQRKGCLLVNSALEVAPHDGEFQRVVTEVLNEVEAFFRHCVEAGQADGTISDYQDPADMGRMLLSTLLGIRVLARTRPERDLLQGLVRPVFYLLRPGDATLSPPPLQKGGHGAKK